MREKSREMVSRGIKVSVESEMREGGPPVY